MSGTFRLVPASCAGCGRGFMARAAAVAKGRGRFCSRSCIRRGPNHHAWKGGRTIASTGYVKAATGVSGGKSEHIVIAERVLGRPLPDGAEVHHFNEQRDDNRNQNLVICNDRDYHALLHRLRRVQLAGGNPFRDRFCAKCHRTKPLDSFPRRTGRPCRECINTAQSAQRAERIRRAS